MKSKTNKNVSKIKIPKSSLPDEPTSVVKTIVLVVGFFALAYLCMILLGKVGFFDKGYERPSAEEEEIAYDTALIGTMFNRPQKVYFVAIDYWGNDKIDKYFQYLVNNYDGETPVYKVDMSLGINAKYIGEKGNIDARDIDDLSIVAPTLIKIKNGKIVQYLQSYSSMKKELSQ